MNAVRHQILYSVILSFLMSCLLYGQYYREQVTEKSFEQSELYFTSHFMNPYGLLRWKQVSVGLFDDPFLRLQLNPANLPNFGEKRSLVYMDFRGDRTEPSIFADYRTYRAAVYDFAPIPPYYYDPRWYSDTRAEPEPIFSLGILVYPIEKLLLGGTYQVIHKKEDFYRIPSWIYYPRFGYDAMGERVSSDYNIPIIDRYYGEDEMTNNAQLFSGFLGYKLSDRLHLGATVNGITQSREGSYIHSSRDEYNSSNDDEWFNFTLREKNQDYDHIDLSGGIRFFFTHQFSAGVKAGYLNGTAKQDYRSVDSSKYQYGDLSDPWNWSRNASQSITDQNWDHDGNSTYGRISGNYQLPQGNEVTLCYRYSKTDIDFQNASTIRDTAFYKSRWTWDTTYSIHRHFSSLKDTREGKGKRAIKDHQISLNFKWNLTPKNTIYTGIYYASEKSTINSLEPVIADRYSEYFHYHSKYEPDSTTHINRLYENKMLDWQYSSNYWTIQIPIVVHFRFNKYWGFMIGVNRIMESWNIEEQTLAVFNRREKEQNGSTTVETDFGERYTQPSQNFTEDYTDVIANFEVNVSEQLKINLLLDPGFDETFKIYQWWLGFRANL